ncbi:hypothetical protein R6Q57_024449 [Mikania cordata]
MDGLIKISVKVANKNLQEHATTMKSEASKMRKMLIFSWIGFLIYRDGNKREESYYFAHKWRAHDWFSRLKLTGLARKDKAGQF